MREIIMIAAMDFNNAIGKGNKLLCNLKDDMHMFKVATTHNIVVMGRKTYESIGKPLPNRINIVLTKGAYYIPEEYRGNLKFMNSVEAVLNYFAKQDKEMFIIGGEQIYEQFLPHATALFISRIETFFEDADTFFPPINWEEWESIEGSGQHFEKNDRNEYPFTHYAYMR